MHFSIPTISALLLLVGGAAATDATFYQYDGCSGGLYTRYGLPSNTCVILAIVTDIDLQDGASWTNSRTTRLHGIQRPSIDRAR